ncbi:MAG: VWA domain-containing protein [Bdellovibrionota bacterium]|nr:VWA domain-containing protein [Bdellovibrionota bacterium]
MIRLAYPWFLCLFLVIVPIFIWGQKSGGKIRFSSIDLLKSMNMRARNNPKLILLILRSLAIILLVVALARPQSGRQFTKTNSEGVDILLVLDTSESMQALDFKREGKRVNRLRVVKEVVRDFIKKRPNDRIGLVVFGEEAFTQCPLTLDHGIVMDFLDNIKIGMAGSATALGQAIGIGVNRMKDLKSKSKIMIALTDGRNNAGRLSPLQASKLADHYGVKVYTIGVGTQGKAPFLADTLFGKRYIYQKVDLDESTLKQVASETGAKYFRATNTDELKNIYSLIDKLEKTKIEVKKYTEYNEMFAHFLIPGLFILLLEIFLGQTKLRRIP